MKFEDYNTYPDVISLTVGLNQYKLIKEFDRIEIDLSSRPAYGKLKQGMYARIMCAYNPVMFRRIAELQSGKVIFDK